MRASAPPTARCSTSTPSCSARATNNVAEYRALLLGLERAPGARRQRGRGGRRLRADRQAGAGPLQGQARRDAPAAPRGDGGAAADFERWSIRTVPRAQNADADALVNAALDQAAALEPRGALPSVQRLRRFRDREHLRVREFLEQRVRQPVEDVALAPADHVDVVAVVDDLVVAPVDRPACERARTAAGSASRCPRSRSSRRSWFCCQTTT